MVIKSFKGHDTYGRQIAVTSSPIRALTSLSEENRPVMKIFNLQGFLFIPISNALLSVLV